MKARELAQILMAGAALLGAAGNFVRHVRGETKQDAQDQNVALTAGDLAERIAALEGKCEP